MAIITSITDAWSDALTLSSDERWQIRHGQVFVATDAATAPANTQDAFLLADGDIMDFNGGEVIRYRRAGAQPRNPEIVRRAKV